MTQALQIMRLNHGLNDGVKKKDWGLFFPI